MHTCIHTYIHTYIHTPLFDTITVTTYLHTCSDRDPRSFLGIPLCESACPPAYRMLPAICYRPFLKLKYPDAPIPLIKPLKLKKNMAGRRLPCDQVLHEVVGLLCQFPWCRARKEGYQDL